jgi:hypothetical protein
LEGSGSIPLTDGSGSGWPQKHPDPDTVVKIFSRVDQETVVLESCHSYIHDLLKQLGPTNAMDPAIQQEINNFPPEAKVSPDLISVSHQDSLSPDLDPIQT